MIDALIKRATARVLRSINMIAKVQKNHILVCFKEEISQYMSTFMSRADINF